MFIKSEIYWEQLQITNLVFILLEAFFLFAFHLTQE